MKETAIIDWLIALAENEAKRRKLTPQQRKTFDARIKTASEIKAKIKRVDYFGGVESLIAKASIVAKNENLFSEF